MTYKPTDEDRGMVKGLVLAGIAQERIAKILKMSNKTLAKHFRSELDEALDTNKGLLANMAWRMALYDKDPRMVMFLCKTQLRWQERAPETTEEERTHYVFSFDEPPKRKQNGKT